MALHCFPHPYCEDGCPVDGSTGRAHRDDESCPFKADPLPKTSFDTCCSLYAEPSLDELFALGLHRLADRMLKDMTPEETLAFARALKRATAKLESLVAQRRQPRLRGAGHDGHYDYRKRTWVYKRYSTISEAVAAIDIAAGWYEKVAALGFGVYAENRTRIWLKK
jgi:hypothetical protein